MSSQRSTDNGKRGTYDDRPSSSQDAKRLKVEDPDRSQQQDELLDEFIQLLTEVPPLPNCFNPYNSQENATHDTIRKNNLKIFLTHMIALKPTIIIIGEAPGYRGCHWSGIPLCGEFIMMNEYNPKIKTQYHKSLLFGPSKGYKKTSDQTGKGYKEATATSIWDILSRVTPSDSPPPMMWNSCFLHSYQPGNQKKNRNPTNTELDQLLHIVRFVFLKLFPDISTVVALGRKAEYSLTKLKSTPELSYLNFEYVRHPSHRGKPECERGLTKVLANSTSQSA